MCKVRGHIFCPYIYIYIFISMDDRTATHPVIRSFKTRIGLRFTECLFPRNFPRFFSTSLFEDRVPKWKNTKQNVGTRREKKDKHYHIALNTFGSIVNPVTLSHQCRLDWGTRLLQHQTKSTEITLSGIAWDNRNILCIRIVMFN